jgi:hypothetical protein
LRDSIKARVESGHRIRIGDLDRRRDNYEKGG